MELNTKQKTDRTWNKTEQYKTWNKTNQNNDLEQNKGLGTK